MGTPKRNTLDWFLTLLQYVQLHSCRHNLHSGMFPYARRKTGAYSAQTTDFTQLNSTQPSPSSLSSISNVHIAFVEIFVQVLRRYSSRCCLCIRYRILLYMLVFSREVNGPTFHLGEAEFTQPIEKLLVPGKGKTLPKVQFISADGRSGMTKPI